MSDYFQLAVDLSRAHADAYAPVVVLCAWCGRCLQGGIATAARPISHGMCPSCSRAFLERLEIGRWPKEGGNPWGIGS